MSCLRIHVHSEPVYNVFQRTEKRNSILSTEYIRFLVTFKNSRQASAKSSYAHRRRPELVYRFITWNLCIIQAQCDSCGTCVHHALRIEPSSVPVCVYRAPSLPPSLSLSFGDTQRSVTVTKPRYRQPIHCTGLHARYTLRAHARGSHDKFCSPAIITPAKDAISIVSMRYEWRRRRQRGRQNHRSCCSRSILRLSQTKCNIICIMIYDDYNTPIDYIMCGAVWQRHCRFNSVREE